MALSEHFLLDSDFPTDKLVFMVEGDITTTHAWGDPDMKWVNTHSPTMIYAAGECNHPGSSDVYPIDNSNPLLVHLYTMMFQGECWIGIRKVAFDESMIGDKAEYRIWGYISDEESKNTDFGMTSNVSKAKLIINSDENYPKFVGEGYLPQGEFYHHNLGYIPIVKSWARYETASILRPDGTKGSATAYYPKDTMGFIGQVKDDEPFRSGYVHVTDTIIRTFTDPSNPENKGIYFRMYKV